MKTKIRLIAAVLTISLLTISPLVLNAQGGNPPPPPDEHGQSGNLPPGGGAPIGSGIGILLVLGAAYGRKKAYEIRKAGRRFRRMRNTSPVIPAISIGLS
jgi:hypothetical protein